MDKTAHCLVCNRQANLSANFLCGNCVNTKSIIVTCACGRRYEIMPDDPATAELAKEIGQPLTAGTAIKADNCRACSAAAESKMTVFRIKRSDA